MKDLRYFLACNLLLQLCWRSPLFHHFRIHLQETRVGYHWLSLENSIRMACLSASHTTGVADLEFEEEHKTMRNKGRNLLQRYANIYIKKISYSSCYGVFITCLALHDEPDCEGVVVVVWGRGGGGGAVATVGRCVIGCGHPSKTSELAILQYWLW